MEPFVPERDGRIGQPAGGPSTPKSPPPDLSRPRRGGGGDSRAVTVALFVITALLVVMVLLQWNSLSNLRERFDNLQGLIESTDESLSESGTALTMRLQQQAEELEGQGDKLEQHFSEIDKLWAARKNINENLDAIQTQINSLEENIKGYDGKIATAEKQAKEARNSAVASVSKLEGNIGTLRKEVLDLKLGFETLENQAAKVEGKLKSHDEAIAAIDSFRRNMNNELLKMRQGQGGGASSAQLDKIRSDIELLKRQHPYLE